jgi:DNA primase
MSLANIDLNPQLIQAVRDAVDIVSLASEHTRLQKAGRKYKGLCPIHKEKTPSFSVDPDKGLFYCFGCGAGGDAIRLHMLSTGDDFPAAIETLAQRYGIPISRRSSRARQDDGRDVHGALEAAEVFFREQLARAEGPRRYLEERHMPPELVDRFGLGFAPDGWQHLVDALTPKVPLEDLVAAGLVGRSDRSDGRPFDRFRNRLIFPIRSATGRLLGFGGRTLGDDKAKYINTQETEQFHKGRLLYGLYEAKKSLRDTGTAILTEGYFDVLAVIAAGREGAVASMGTALTEEQAVLLARFSEEVVLAYDGDDAGEKAARRCLPILLGRGFRIKKASLGPGQDPDSLRLEEGPEALLAALDEAPDALLEELYRLAPTSVRADPKAQADAANDVAELLRAIPDAIVRRGYGRLVADRLDVPEELLWKRSKRGAQGRIATAEAATEQKDAALWRLETELLENLLKIRTDVPALEDLPAPEIFPDRVCQEIYLSFLDTYRRLGRAPDLEEVARGLGTASDASALLARIDHDPTPKGLFNGTLALFARLDQWWVHKEFRRVNNLLRSDQVADNDRIHALNDWKDEIRKIQKSVRQPQQWLFALVQETRGSGP